MENIKNLVEEKLNKYNQSHILREIEGLDENEKQELYEQISKIDFEEIENLYKEIGKDLNFEKLNISPMDYVDKSKLDENERQRLEVLGKNIIENDQYAVVTLAGGQGTRLGFNGPKGTYKLDIGENGKYIFQILTEILKKSKDLYGTLPYWYIMTSAQNYEQTVNFFEEHNFFGYDKEKVKFFKQGELPLLTKEGKMLLEGNKVKMASNGNGGVYKALRKEKMIDDMKSKGIKWVYIFGVDNIMVKPIDAIFLGLAIDKNMEVAGKSIDKAYPEERVGVFCKKNGVPGVIEYTELPENMRYARNNEGELLYKEAPFINFLLSIDAIEKVSKEDLEYHLAIKNDLYKFETFVFDMFKFFDDVLIMRAERDEEFAPIKNKTGVDSPETAVQIYEKSLNK